MVEQGDLRYMLTSCWVVADVRGLWCWSGTEVVRLGWELGRSRNGTDDPCPAMFLIIWLYLAPFSFFISPSIVLFQYLAKIL